jgi:hypothetical protein
MFGEVRPIFEVVNEGLILNLVPGYRRFTLFPMVYDEKSSPVEKRFEISNLQLIKDMEKIIKFKEVFVNQNLTC